MTAPSDLSPDPQLRELLLNYFIDSLTGAELTDWLQQLGAETRGSVAEKQQRVRAHTKYLTMPAREFPAQTQNYLAVYSSDHLADLCEHLGLSPAGTKDARYRRIMRAVHTREGWLPRIAAPFDVKTLTAATVAPFLAWFPISCEGEYERDFYPIIRDELSEVFGSAVYEQLPVAHGSTLKIDFHVGDPSGHGVGIEVKMPTNNADVQRAVGQLDQYQRRYGHNLILLVLGEFLKREILSSFIDALKGRSIATVVR